MTKFGASNLFSDPRVAIDGELASAVAVNGTFTLNYPAGISIGSAQLASRHYLKLNDGIRLYPYDGVNYGFSVAFGDSAITITNKTGQSWPAGTKVRFIMDMTARDMTSAADTLNAPLGQGFDNADGHYGAGQFKTAELRSVLMHLGQPDVSDVDFFASFSQSVAGTAVTLTNNYPDFPRTVVADSTSASDTSAKKVRIHGLDSIGEPLGNGVGYFDLALNGTTDVESQVAVSYISAIELVDANGDDVVSVGTITVGTGTKLGLPMRCLDATFQIQRVIEDTHNGSPTVLLNSSAAAKITAGDISIVTKDKRGLLTPTNTFDSGYDYFVQMWVSDPTDGGQYRPKDQTQRVY